MLLEKQLHNNARIVKNTRRGKYTETPNITVSGTLAIATTAFQGDLKPFHM